MTMQEVWRPLNVTARPQVGQRYEIVLHEAIRDEQGDVLGGSSAEVVEGTVVAVGAHWSHQPAGESGWHARISFAPPRAADYI